MLRRHGSLRSASALLLSLVLGACGGGGGYGGGGGGGGTTTLSAGTDQSVNSASGVTLAGTCSGPYCANGYQWTQTGGTAVTLSGATTLTPSFTAPTVVAITTLTFDVAIVGSCNAYGGSGVCPTDSMTVTVNPPGTTVTISGKVQYQRVPHTAADALDYANTAATNVRGATVQARQGSAASTCASGTLLDSAITDGNGDYSVDVPSNTTLKVCVRAELLQADAGAGSASWDVQVVDNTNSDALYILESTATTSGGSNSTRNLTAASGWGGAGYTSTRAAAPFAILDDAYRAIQKILAVAPTTDFAALDFNWSVNNTNASGGGGIPVGNIGTSFYSADEIYILGDDDNDTDEYDDHVIIHEYGHYLEDNQSRSDSVGGSHSGGDRLDLRVAYGEGFGNAWSGIVTDDPVYQDSFGALQGSGFDIDVENDAVTATQAGWFSETSAQRILYDLYDTTNEGSGDTASVGLAAMWTVWSSSQAATPAVTSIFSFLDGLRTAAPGSVAFINALAAANDVNGSDEFGAGETDNGSLADGSGACAGINTALPVHFAYTIGSGAFVVPVGNQVGEYNKLGNRRLIAVTPGSTALRTLSVTGPSGTDVDAVLYQDGVALDQQFNSGNETWQRTLTSGVTYVLEVMACENVFNGDCAGNGTTNSAGARCLTVEIN